MPVTSSVESNPSSLFRFLVPQRQFELAFKMFDTDGNGRLDHREFKQVHHCVCLKLWQANN